MKAIFKCLSMVAMLSATYASAHDTDLYARVYALWEKAGMPTSTSMSAETIWTGKCVNSNDRMKRFNGSIFFHVEQDPILGSIFSMIPLTNHADEQCDFDSLYEKSMEYINNNRVLSYVGLLPEERAWTARVKMGGSSDRTVYLREFKQANGKPAFAMRISQAYESNLIFCYLYEERSGSNKGGEVTPPSGEPVPAPEP